MIEPKLCRHWKRCSSVPSLRRRHENLLFHSDMPEQARSKSIVHSPRHLVSGNNGCLKKLLQSPMILGEKAHDEPWFMLWWLHHVQTGERRL